MPLDKKTESERTRYVKSNLPKRLSALGFKKLRSGSCVLDLQGHECIVWLQKFRHQPAFRVAMTFISADGSEVGRVTEFADKYTYRDSPSGRQYDFGLRWGDSAAVNCLDEIVEFVKNVAIPWFELQASNADNRT